MNGILPAAYAGCIGINGGINGDGQDIGGMADVETAAPLIIICGGRKKSGFGKAGNWAADDTEAAAAAAAAAAAGVLVEVDDESASDDADDSLVAGFSFSPYNKHTECSPLISTDIYRVSENKYER